MNKNQKNEMVLNAVKMYEDLQSRKIHPAGKFDKAGRFYPSEKFSCCSNIRSPSRAFPYSYMVHCRTLGHVCNQSGVLLADAKAVISQKKKNQNLIKKTYNPGKIDIFTADLWLDLATNY